MPMEPIDIHGDNPDNCPKCGGPRIRFGTALIHAADVFRENPDGSPRSRTECPADDGIPSNPFLRHQLHQFPAPNTDGLNIPPNDGGMQLHEFYPRESLNMQRLRAELDDNRMSDCHTCGGPRIWSGGYIIHEADKNRGGSPYKYRWAASECARGIAPEPIRVQRGGRQSGKSRPMVEHGKGRLQMLLPADAVAVETFMGLVRSLAGEGAAISVSSDGETFTATWKARR